MRLQLPSFPLCRLEIRRIMTLAACRGDQSQGTGCYTPLKDGPTWRNLRGDEHQSTQTFMDLIFNPLLGNIGYYGGGLGLLVVIVVVVLLLKR